MPLNRFMLERLVLSGEYRRCLSIPSRKIARSLALRRLKSSIASGENKISYLILAII